MRLALITSQAFSLSNFRGPLIAALVAQGVEVFAIAPDYDVQTRAAVLELGATAVDCTLSRTGMNPVEDFLSVFRLAALLRNLRIDISLGYFVKPVIFGTLAATLAGIPQRFCMIEGLGYVFTPASGVETLQRRLLRTMVSWLYKFALKFANRVFLLNDADIADMVSQGLVQKSQVVKLGAIGVDLAQWLPVACVTEPVTFLLAARLLREKGIVEYAEAASMVKAKFPATRFLLLGGLDPNPGGLTLDEVRAWVEQGLLEWPGHVPVKNWLAQASVYVLPSYYREGVPRSTQEAMAMGRAVITSDAPGCRDTVVEGLNGFLVPVRDPESLARAMLRFIQQPELIKSMGAASRSLALERFDVHKVNAVMLAAMGIGK